MRITAELIQKSPQFFNPLVRALCRAGASSFIANRGPNSCPLFNSMAHSTSASWICEVSSKNTEFFVFF
jgi:hypothetical protein